MNKMEFAKAILNKYIETFVIYKTFLLIIAIYPAKKVQIALLVIKKIRISIKYSDFSEVFFKKKSFDFTKDN